jgi:hypothetical protein
MPEPFRFSDELFVLNTDSCLIFLRAADTQSLALSR